MAAADDGPEYMLFFRTSRGEAIKPITQAQYINDLAQRTRVELINLDEGGPRPPYVRGVPTLVRVEKYGERGPSRWEGKDGLKRLEALSGAKGLKADARPPRGGGGTPNALAASSSSSQEVSVPQFDAPESVPDDDWGAEPSDDGAFADEELF